MKRILVGIKRVVDFSVRVRAKPDGSGIVTDGVKMSANPFDEIALEEALRLRERGAADEVVVIGIGPIECQQQLRNALAMGADRAIHVQAEGMVEPAVIARIFLKLIETEQPFAVILGKQAIDDDNGQTGQMLAAVFTTDLRLNEPRYVKLPDIMKAKKKPLSILTMAQLSIDSAPRMKLLRFEPPAQRQKGIRVKDVAELVAALRARGLFQ